MGSVWIGVAVAGLVGIVVVVAIGVAIFKASPPPEDRGGDPKPRPVPEAEGSPTELDTTVLVRLGSELFAVAAHVSIEPGRNGSIAIGLSDEALGPDDGLELHRDGDAVTASMTLQGQRGELFDTASLAILGLTDEDGDPQEIPGLQAPFSFPHSGSFHRLRDVFIGFPESPELVEAVAGILDPDPEPDATIPWTLEGATRVALDRLSRTAGVDSAEIAGPGVIRYTSHGNDGRMDLGNVFPEIAGSGPDGGLAVLERFVSSLTMAPPSQTAQEQLLIRVYPGAAPFTVSPAPDVELTFASFPIAEDLVGVYVQDTPQAMRPLPEEERVELVADDDEARTLARTNLLRELPIIRIRGEGPVFMLIAGGNYESSVPLLPELWDAMESLLDGPPLVALPARDLCLITGEVEGRIEHLASLVGEIEELAYPISDGVYRVVGRGDRMERVR